jgi:Glycosyl transferase family 90
VRVLLFAQHENSISIPQILNHDKLSSKDMGISQAQDCIWPQSTMLRRSTRPQLERRHEGSGGYSVQSGGQDGDDDDLKNETSMRAMWIPPKVLILWLSPYRKYRSAMLLIFGVAVVFWLGSLWTRTLSGTETECHTLLQRHEKVVQNNTKQHFPRWDDEFGFDIQSLVEAIQKRLDSPSHLLTEDESNQMPSFHKVYVIARGKEDMELWSLSMPFQNKSQIISERARLTEPMLLKTVQMLGSRLAKTFTTEPRAMESIQAVIRRWGGLVFVVNYGDSLWCCSDDTESLDVAPPPSPPLPIFTMSAPWSSQCRHAFPMPTYETMIRATKRQASAKKRIIPLSWDSWLYYPWYRRIRKAVWRGSPTGPVKFWKPRLDSQSLSDGNRHLLDGQVTHLDLRWDLCKEGYEHPEWIDAMFVGTQELWPRLSEYPQYVGDRIDVRDYQKYRAVIDVDGNSWSSRFGQLLCLSSVVLKVEPQYVDYFYPELQAWKHYIPVHLGGSKESNLLQMAKCAVADENSGLVQGIVANANQWCRDKMKPESLARDMARILETYAALALRHNLTRQLPSLQTSTMIPNLLSSQKFTRITPPSTT